MDENRTAKQPYLNGAATVYGEPFPAYLDHREIGWVACWCDDGWNPPMFTPGRQEPTLHGTFVLEALKVGW